VFVQQDYFNSKEIVFSPAQQDFSPTQVHVNVHLVLLNVKVVILEYLEQDVFLVPQVSLLSFLDPISLV
jgi:hypothetical protein